MVGYASTNQLITNLCFFPYLLMAKKNQIQTDVFENTTTNKNLSKYLTLKGTLVQCEKVADIINCDSIANLVQHKKVYSHWDSQNSAKFLP